MIKNRIIVLVLSLGFVQLRSAEIEEYSPMHLVNAYVRGELDDFEPQKFCNMIKENTNLPDVNTNNILLEENLSYALAILTASFVLTRAKETTYFNLADALFKNGASAYWKDTSGNTILQGLFNISVKLEQHSVKNPFYRNFIAIKYLTQRAGILPKNCLESPFFLQLEENGTVLSKEMAQYFRDNTD